MQVNKLFDEVIFMRSSVFISIRMCNMTHSYMTMTNPRVWHDDSYMICLIHHWNDSFTCDKTQSFVPWRIHMCAVRAVCICAPLVMHMCAISCSHVPWRIHMCAVRAIFICRSWVVHMCAMSHSYVCHESCICVPWVMHMCAMSHSYVCKQLFSCSHVPW